MSALWQRVRGLRGSIPGGPVGLRLAVMAIIDAVGTGAFLAVSVPFVTTSVHLSSGDLGAGLALAAAIALGTAIPIGMVADRIGPKKVLIGVSLWRCGCFLAYPFIRNLWQFLLVVCLLGLVDKAAAPMEQALVGQAVPTTERVKVIAVLRSMRNVGFTLGALLGGVGLLIGTRTGYAVILLLNAASFAVLATLASRLPLLNAPAANLRRRFSASVLRDGSFLSFSGINAVLTMHMTLLSIGIPLWIVGHTDVSAALIAPLLAVNTVLAVVLQVRASRGTETIPGAARALVRAGVSLAACCLLLVAAPKLPVAAAVGVLLLAMIALTGGELWQSAGGWGGSYLLAVPGQEGVYLSVFWLGVSVQQIAAPVVLSLVVTVGTTAWIVLAAVFAASGLVAPAIGRWAQAQEAGRAEQDPSLTPAS
ncbi:MFS transporter [Actinacidiphila sp. ITFR-21]|uniref:MFS transporter n=1 Tax=Actinacidiphila sp. ITFR-21 TaxID=3075199 RepID=UPI00288A0674|nr:MFS transporter [Streptomyces sp. ITFR-21]WNI18848.1 MFS transporter [Streptomyces sp. ITFR-21]